MKITKISLIRHGQVHNPEQVYYGRLPRFRLSVAGCRQAAEAAHFLRDQQVTTVYSSPLLRAKQTADIVAATLNVPLHHSRLMLEVHSPYDGRPLSDLEARNWDIYTDSPAHFEQPDDIANRMTRLIGRIRRNHTHHHTVLVSHADPVAWTVLWAADKPLTLTNRRHLQCAGLPVDYPTYACIVTLSFNDGEERPFAIDYHGVEQG